MIKFIENIGDYFSTNYFDEDFIKKVTDKSGYASEDLKEINKRISPLKDTYYKYKNEYLTLKRPKDRIKLTNTFHSKILDALGYTADTNDYSELFLLEEKEGIPVRLKHYRGDKPHLFIMEMQSLIAEGETPPAGLFEQRYHQQQWEYVFQISDPEISLKPSILNEALSELFLIEEERRPIYVLMLAGSELYLIHYEKWFRGSYLRFSLEDLFDEATLKRDYYSLFYFLLAKETLAPDSDIVLMEQLDEDSHKSAYAVTKDLKEGVIQAIEDLANEAVLYLKENKLVEKLDDELANKLKDDCLVLVYRLLFIFYAESRDELEILPTDDKVYKKGYSLEMLRDLELVPLQSESAKNGYFFHESLIHLFKLIGKGFDPVRATTKSFSVKKIDSPLFDDDRLHYLKNVKFRNFIWQDIIRQLSLSQKQSGRARGRISYANLGINQLGSVYEGLLAYKGFFAEEDYIEVKKADDPTGKEGTYVVPRKRRGDFDEAEIVKDQENPERDKVIPKGTFIYRLSGRDRQKTASYYTPEVLTQTTVKYTLKPILERLEKSEIKADELLNLKILEPAMGAAAFHNEAINQISEAYLDWKQKERKKKAPPNDYREELQRVKAFIATHNVYGVDINPTAVELGKISLWLNVIHKNMETPFFGYRLGVGNAVVGAWRKVYDKDDFIRKIPKGSKKPLKKEWWEKAPRQLSWSGKGSKRKKEEVYHFLLPDKNMVPSAGIKMLKEEYKKEAKYVTEWRKNFTEPILEAEYLTLLLISDQIDDLFVEHYEIQKSINEKTHTKVKVWGQPGYGQEEIFTYREKEDTTRAREETNAPYYKLKMIMDYWCSLWFWDVRDAEHLPTREDFISDILSILDLDIDEALKKEKEAEDADEDVLGVDTQPGLGFDGEQLKLLGYKSTEEKSKLAEVISKHTEKTNLFPDKRKKIVADYAKQYRFFHYELEFVEVFKDRNGFDLIVGNPPWVKVTFEEKDIIAEKFPEIIIRKTNAKQVQIFSKDYNKNKNDRLNYLQEYVSLESSQIFMCALQNYYLLQNQQTNLYRSIIIVGFHLLNDNGYLGLLHPNGVFDDPNAFLLREILYKRLRFYFQFQNELLLFQDIQHVNKFSINIYSGNDAIRIFFYSISNLYHPSTINNSFLHDGSGKVDGLKAHTENGFEWNIKPHRNRIIEVDEEVLKIIALAFENSNQWQITRYAGIHSREIVSVLKKFSEFKTRVKDYKYKVQEGFHETNDLNIVMKRETGYHGRDNSKSILNGAHLNVANPFSQCPREKCIIKSDYDIVDLNIIFEDFFPRTNYTTIKDDLDSIFIPAFQDKDGNFDSIWDYYKLGFRKMLSPPMSRTLLSAIIPPNVLHVNGIVSVSFPDESKLIELAGLTSSILFDYYIKSLSASNLTDGTIKYFPIGIGKKYYDSIAIRTLLLNCLTNAYKNLWKRNYSDNFTSEQWSKEDERLKSYQNIAKNWTWNTPLRNYYERRQSLLEIDVIVAMLFGLSLDELILTYKIQFPVLQQTEADTFYDKKGNIVFTSSKGLVGVGLERKKWEEVMNNTEGEVVKHTIEYELHRGTEITYYPPFEKCDRVEDYKRAWDYFEKVFTDK
jgi:hypothetical protein